ncbi:hypothetical protein [Subtercola frigoramans]|uniref:Asp23/Gls24 family envelope stress response protein n=1 Tax=Subtercola frigoramans TaxID=120298 RepID=A0ABS2L039_9MICO|nr:hypothetical protein [Subtercola frigoramans]MBM7470456.1 hypothetical protein [Subtercola frigoramans]
MDDRTALPSQLSAVVRAVPGVESLYASTPGPVELVSRVVELVTQREVESAEVSVSGKPDNTADLVIKVTIGVEEAASATEVCRDVYDSICSFFTLKGETAPATIAVTVGRIG